MIVSKVLLVIIRTFHCFFPGPGEEVPRIRDPSYTSVRVVHVVCPFGSIGPEPVLRCPFPRKGRSIDLGASGPPSPGTKNDWENGTGVEWTGDRGVGRTEGLSPGSLKENVDDTCLSTLPPKISSPRDPRFRHKSSHVSFAPHPVHGNVP